MHPTVDISWVDNNHSDAVVTAAGFNSSRERDKVHKAETGLQGHRVCYVLYHHYKKINNQDPMAQHS